MIYINCIILHKESLKVWLQLMSKGISCWLCEMNTFSWIKLSLWRPGMRRITWGLLLSAPSHYKLTLICICAVWLWSPTSLQVGIGRMCLILAPNGCLVKSRLHLEGRETGIKDLAAPVFCLLRQVLDCFFFFALEQCLLSPPSYCYIMPELWFVVATWIYWWVLIFKIF